MASARQSHACLQRGALLSSTPPNRTATAPTATTPQPHRNRTATAPQPHPHRNRTATAPQPHRNRNRTATTPQPQPPQPHPPGLVRSRHKVTRSEYVLLLLTFLAIMQFELEMGVAVGIVLCLMFFAFTYARVNMTVSGGCLAGLQQAPWQSFDDLLAC